MHSRPGAEGPHCSLRGRGGHQLQALAHSFTGQRGAVQVLLLLLLRWRWRDFGSPAGANVGGGEGGQAMWHGCGRKNTERLISNKKENSSLYTVVCFGSVQTEYKVVAFDGQQTPNSEEER